MWTSCSKAPSSGPRTAFASPRSWAHVALGLVYFRLEWRWLDAERGFTRAIDLNPGLAAAHHFFALYLEVEPMFDRLRGDPRFARLIRRLQLAY